MGFIPFSLDSMWEVPLGLLIKSRFRRNNLLFYLLFYILVLLLLFLFAHISIYLFIYCFIYLFLYISIVLFDYLLFLLFICCSLYCCIHRFIYYAIVVLLSCSLTKSKKYFLPLFSFGCLLTWESNPNINDKSLHS